VAQYPGLAKFDGVGVQGGACQWEGFTALRELVLAPSKKIQPLPFSVRAMI
jgi:hypothetical protein